MSFALVEDYGYQIVKQIFPSLNTIIAYQNGPELVTPYCVVVCQAFDPVGREEIPSQATLNTGTGNRELRTLQNYQVTLRFEFVGKDTASNHGGNFAVEFGHQLSSPTVQEALRDRNLGLLQKSLIRRIPKLRETVWYNSYVIDVVFSFALETTQQIDIVESVEITGTYQDSVTTIVDVINIP